MNSPTVGNTSLMIFSPARTSSPATTALVVTPPSDAMASLTVRWQDSFFHLRLFHILCYVSVSVFCSFMCLWIKFTFAGRYGWDWLSQSKCNFSPDTFGINSNNNNCSRPHNWGSCIKSFFGGFPFFWFDFQADLPPGRGNGQQIMCNSATEFTCKDLRLCVKLWVEKPSEEPFYVFFQGGALWWFPRLHWCVRWK